MKGVFGLADAKPDVYVCGMMRVTVLDRVLPPPSEKTVSLVNRK